ncbi:MAG: excinuclease ABC subunit UvrA [Synergistaceae bacterium]|nr:excinuclease ABC subunit UvrA [Synergistaceae bacterium]
MSEWIRISGARQHNLKNISVDLPKNKLVLLTGPSGSGKSSLAFDTIYAEGQRRYVESLSSYARQFLGMQDKPDVDDISGLSPAISIEQKGTSHNPRSTVGTVTEIYDYMRLLYGRAGVPHCPSCGKPVFRYSLDEIVDMIYREYDDRPIEIMSPLVRGKKGEYKNLLLQLRAQGYLRARIDGETYWIEEDIPLDKRKRHSIDAVIDRLKVKEEARSRISEAVEAALRLSEGFVTIHSEGALDLDLTEKYICPDCQVSLPEIEPRLFSFNNPFGACPECSGLGVHQHFSPDLAVVGDLSVLDGAFLPWRGNKYMIPRAQIIANRHGWNLRMPFDALPKEAREVLLYGSDEKITLTFVDKHGESEYQGHYEGLIPWLTRRFEETESENWREDMVRYRVDDICSACEGRRLKREALAVKLGDYNISELTAMPVEDLIPILESISLTENQRNIAGLPLIEIQKRLAFLVDVGAGYLSLDRRADTLSGGESQRIRLATQIGSKLTGVLYVLDEPTIGLHPKDTNRLLDTLCTIRDLGNTVIVVEHDRDALKAADYVLELGPGAGEAGGNVVIQGEPEVIESSGSLSGAFLRGEITGIIKAEGGMRTPKGWIYVKGCRENNLKNIDVAVPTGVLASMCGLSGSGKSTFLYEILYKGLRMKLDSEYRDRAGKYDSISGSEGLRNVVLVDQSPIGRTPRSNPATYTGVFTPIREFFAQLPESKLRGYTASRFSFNVKGGRCEACSGDGVIKVSMLFMPDVYIKCDVCRGMRYNRETLEVVHKGLSIADVLDLTVDEAFDHFHDIPRIASKLGVIREAGLGYIKLGQRATTLSGGEAQRVKLATELGKKFRGNVLYLLDEPTTGLHYTDVKKLLVLLHKLVDLGNSVLLIEHNLDVLISSDYLIDLGPEGGARGGELVACGTPEGVATSKGYTGAYLKGYMNELEHSADLIRGSKVPGRRKAG